MKADLGRRHQCTQFVRLGRRSQGNRAETSDTRGTVRPIPMSSLGSRESMQRTSTSPPSPTLSSNWRFCSSSTAMPHRARGCTPGCVSGFSRASGANSTRRPGSRAPLCPAPCSRPLSPARRPYRSDIPRSGHDRRDTQLRRIRADQRSSAQSLDCRRDMISSINTPTAPILTAVTSCSPRHLRRTAPLRPETSMWVHSPFP